MTKHFTKTSLIILLILISILIFAIPKNSVFATNEHIKITIIGDGCVSVNATSGTIYGYIESADINEDSANNKLNDLKNNLSSFLQSFSDYTLTLNYTNSYPVDPICYRGNAYMACASFEIEVSNIESLHAIYSNLTNEEYVLTGIQYSASDTSSYIDALKQAIAKANFKLTALYSNSNYSIIEIEEKSSYNSNTLFVNEPNIDTSITPTITICAKIEATYKVNQS